MIILTLRYQRGHFALSGSDIGFQKFETRRDARKWCAEHHPGAPIREFGAAAAKRIKSRKARAAPSPPNPPNSSQ